jgi:hypothetical protein
MTMTTNIREEKKAMSESRNIMRSLINSHGSLAVIRFFAEHPNGRFSKLAVIHALDKTDRHRAIEEAIDDLVSNGVLKTLIANTVCYYRLTLEEPVRGIVLRTAELDWHQWQLVYGFD